MIDIDPGTIFAASLLVGGFLAAVVVLLIALFLAIQMIWEYFHGPSDLEQEQEQAVGIAEAYVIQYHDDSLRRWKLYMTILVAQAVMIRHFHSWRFHDNDSGKGACI